MKALVLAAAALLAFPAYAQEKKEAPIHKDISLTTRVKSAMAADVGLKTLAINVDTDASTGTVTLQGRVDTAETKRRAEDVARKVEGVKKVDNRLEVGKG